MELSSHGMGTANGTRRLWIDGVLVASTTGVDFRNHSLNTIRFGSPDQGDRRFTGNLDFDDVRLSPQPPASKLMVTTSGGPYAPGACVPVTVTLRDSIATALAPAPYSTVVALSSSVGGDVFHSNSGCSSVVSSVTIPAAGNTGTLYVVPATSGNRTLTAQHADFLTGTTTLPVSAPTASRLAFTNPARTYTAGVCGGAGGVITVQLRDGANNPINAGPGGQAFTASSTGTETWFTDVGCSATASGGTFTIPSGSNSVDLYYRDTLAGTPTVTLTNSSGLTNPTGQVHTVNPGAATKLAFSVQPTSALAGASLSPAVRVVVQDANNNTVTGSSASITLALGTNPGGSTLSGTNPVSAAAGIATFSNLSLNRVGTGYTLVASAAGLTGATSSAFNITPGAATKLAFTVQPSGAQAGASIAPAVQVAVQDANNNTITSSTASVALALGSNPNGSTLSGTNPVSASAGVATFSNLSLNRVGTGYTLVATAAGLTSATSSAFNITVGAATRLGFIVQPTTTAAGGVVTPSVQVAIQDSSGNTVTSSAASITLGLAANPGGSMLSGTLTVGTSAGVAAFANLSLDKVGTGYTLVASAAGLTGATSSTFNITPGAASRLAFTAQPGSAQAGASLAPSIRVTVQDANGNTVTSSSASVALALSANPGGSTLSGTTPVAAVNGVATFSNLSLNRVGTGYTLFASSGSLAGATSNAFNITPGMATRLAFLVQPTNVLAGASITPAVSVAVQDANGNTVTSSSAVIAVALGANPGGSALSGTTSASASAGVATFSNLSLNVADNGYGLSATSSGLTSATSATFDVLPASATRLVFSVQPSNTAAGAAISPGVQIEVQDDLGNLVSGSTAPITVAVSANPGSSTLSGTLTVNAVGGVATFSNLSLNRVGTGYSLAASSAGFVGAVSGAFNILPGAATALAFSVQPPDSQAGVVLAPAVQVRVVDGNGNTVTGSSASITVSLGSNPGGATLAGTVTVSAASGVASFSTLSLNRTGTGYTLLASASGLAQATSDSFDIAPGAANRLAFSVQPGDSAAGAPISPAVSVLVQDSSGNTVLGSTASVTLAIGTNPSAGVLSGTTTVAASNGVATFSNLAIDRAGVGYTLVASATGLTAATSTAFSVSAGAASRLSFSVQPTNAVAGAAISPAIQVRVEDNNGNLVTTSTVGVTLAPANNPSAGTLSGTVVRSAVAGVATFPGLSIDRAGVGYTLAASSAGLTGGTSAAFNVTVGAAARIAFGLEPPNGAAGTALAPAFTVQVLDGSGNLVTSSSASITVVLGANPGGATLAGTVNISAASGVATFSNVRLDRVGSGYTLIASASGLASDTSAPFAIGAGAAAALDFTGPPSDTTAGAAIAPAVQVSVRDSSGNLVSGSSASVALAFGNNPGDGALGGTLTVAAVNGVASFSNLTIDRAGNGYTLSASSTGLAGDVSPSFDVAGGGAAQLAFTTPARTVTAGACSPVVSVQAEDGLGNPATIGSGVSLMMALAGAQLFADAACVSALGTVSLSPGAPQASLHFRGSQAGTFNLVASTSGLNGASQQETIAAGPATELEVRGFPSPTGAGQLAPITVTARDVFGNRVLTFVGPIAFSSTDPLAQLPAGMTMVSGNQGEVTVSGALRTLGMQTLSASSGSLTGSQTGILVRPGPAHHFALTGIPSPTQINRPENFALTAFDQFNNIAIDHSGTVRFASSDVFAALPQPLSFTPAMQGSATLTNGVRFRSAGTHDVVAMDASNPLIWGAQTGIVVSANSPPLITRNANLQATVGSAYRYNALGRIEANGAKPMTYQPCGGPAGFQVDAQTGTVGWTPAAAGTVSVCVKATNAHGEDSYAFTIAVVQRTPTPVHAAFTAMPDAGPAPLTVQLDASPSQGDPSASPLMYQWSFGDGSPLATGLAPRRNYLLPGGYRPRLDVFDAFGAQAQATAAIQVHSANGDVPPTARIIASATSGRDSLSVELSCDCERGSAPIAGYSWQLGNGPPQSGPTASTVFGPGSYDVQLTVVDTAGLAATDSVPITVTRGDLVPPQCRAAADPPNGDAPFSTVWTGEALAGSAPVVRQDWMLEEGLVSGATVSRTYAQPGSHWGRFRVEDSNGLTCQSSTWVTATAAGMLPPKIVSAASAQASCGEPFLHTALMASDSPQGWSLAEATHGMALEGATGELRWTPSREQMGSHSVRLIASGLAGSAEQTLVVDVACERKQLSVGCSAGGSSLAPVWLVALFAVCLHLVFRARSGISCSPTRGTAERATGRRGSSRRTSR